MESFPRSQFARPLLVPGHFSDTLRPRAFVRGLLQLPIIWFSAVDNISLHRSLATPSTRIKGEWGGLGGFISHREEEMQPGIRDVCFGFFNEVFNIIRLHAQFPKELPTETTESSVGVYHLPVAERLEFSFVWPRVA